MWRILVFTLCSIGESAFAGSLAEYVNVLNPKMSVTIETQPDRFAIVDVAFDATTCSPRDELICFESVGFQFAVPKNISNKRKWAYKGMKYEVSNQITSPMWGRPGPFWLIEQKDKPGLKFVYSSTSGLIMLGGLGQPPGSLFVLIQSCGFGAASDCKNEETLPQ